MKIMYILDSNDPDQQSDIKYLHHARDYHTALWEIDQKIRSWQKYESQPTLEKADRLLDELRSMSNNWTWED